MKNHFFLCKFKGEEFITITNKKRIIEIEESDDGYQIEELNDFQVKEISKDYPEKSYSILLDGVKNDSLIDFSMIKSINFKTINFYNSRIDISIPEDIREKVNTLFFNGNSKGVLDLGKYQSLTDVNILEWNKLIDILDSTKKNKIKNLTVWYYKPKNKLLKPLIDSFLNLEKLNIFHTNISNLSGIENLNNIKSVELHYGRSLKSIISLNNCSSIEKVFFQGCSKIEDFNKVKLNNKTLIIGSKIYR